MPEGILPVEKKAEVQGMMEEPILRFTCRYQGCNQPVWKNVINAKYCLVHKKVRNQESRQKQNYRRKLKRMAENHEKVKCQICNTAITRKNKYCSKKCAHAGLLLKRRKNTAIKRIDAKVKEIQKLLELIK